MISKIHSLNPQCGVGWTPKRGDLLLIHNPVFGNDYYTRHYSEMPIDTVYVVVKRERGSSSDFPRLVIRPVSSKDTRNDYETFTCRKGFNKYFKPYLEVKGALIKELTID